jgi:alkanesulfonate monooxygenase SsuD/methylene tetrahydromethanopterin reductase-like flavin-dependent oxidoreductase (luciferase family)
MDLPKPHTIVATSVVCADTDERLEELVALSALVRTRARSGLSGPLPSLSEALASTYTPAELAETVRNQRIMGTPAEVEEQLERLIERTRADELMITLPVYGHENRVHMLELLARAFDLTPLARGAGERAVVQRGS